ncbi:TonB-dependent receptor domain-containing protein [Tenacibaculum sp. SG-28]|uniref:TonB-dependent receptor domain-containing protein n=1 Tax=Tenacibaculum sp. SG-28 TaxID=754426 RepID=UPI001E4736F9|nr:TonB-dependent receptor [Tenacibaculum sp. SG-28]
MQFANAQERTISGVVTSASDNGPIPGVGILVKGTVRGTETDFDGKYQIQVSEGDVLQFSYVGMKTKTVTVLNQTTINVSLEDDSLLDEVVVTALGIKKTRKSLTYAAQDVKAEEISRVKQTNPINSLSGKVSGLTITRSASGAGGSVKVLLRGVASFGNNQPLYVIDGIPLNNISSSQPSDTFGEINGGNRDGGDALSLLNPDDVESLTVLKGASASALYGSAGLNGVILITTKKGKEGNFKVNFSSNLTVDSAAYYMDFNDTAQANVDDFFSTGTTNINSLSFSGGTEKAQTYFSYSNTFSEGILPTNSLKQHTFNIRETAKFFEDKLTLNASVIGTVQSIRNRPVSGLYFNPLVGVYGFQSDTEKLSDYSVFEEYDSNRNLMKQRWFRPTYDIEQNPYWILNRNTSEDENKKLVASLNLKFKVNDWLSLQTRGTYDQSYVNFEKKIYATTEATLAPLNGRYILNENDYTQMYGDLIANINTNLGEDFSISAIVGVSTQRNTAELFVADSGTNGDLQFANVFALQNFNGNAATTFQQNSFESRTNSIFSSATIGYKDKIFFDITGRNDWTSTLPKSSNSFFYPSFGITGILSETFNVPFAKVRASYGEVGSGVGTDTYSPNRSILFANGINPNDPIRPLPGTIPKPERQRSFEIGTEWKFDNFGFDIGYYYTSTINQYFSFGIPDSLVRGIGLAGLNAGDITNSGIEASVYFKPIRSENFRWTTMFNFATNKNEVKSLTTENLIEGVEESFFEISPAGVNTFGAYLVEGGAFGDIYVQELVRDDNGVPIYDNDSFIIKTDDSNDIALTKVGNPNPDWTLGWSNSFQYKNLSLDFLIDGKFGGETVSMTEAVVEGFSNNSARETANRDVTVVDLNGNTSTLSAQEYYGAVGGRNGFLGEYVYSATNVRLAELALGYSFNLGENSFFKMAKASLVGSNLFFFYKDAPHDPNVSLSTGNALQGVDILGLPSTRSLGLNINLTF